MIRCSKRLKSGDDFLLSPRSRHCHFWPGDLWIWDKSRPAVWHLWPIVALYIFHGSRSRMLHWVFAHTLFLLSEDATSNETFPSNQEPAKQH